MTLSPGTKIGLEEILSPLGAEDIGEVSRGYVSVYSDNSAQKPGRGNDAGLRKQYLLLIMLSHSCCSADDYRVCGFLDL